MELFAATAEVRDSLDWPTAIVLVAALFCLAWSLR